MKERVGWTDEELDSLSPKQWMFVNSERKLMHYKMIAEVVRINDHCELQPKIGDKYVFNGAGMLIPEESTFPAICLGALAGIAPLSVMVMDRILADLDPNEMWRDQATCADLSLRNGGLGEVVFKIYCVKI
jgi:uncharacterized repeat protein (TIGR04076 family)